MPTFRSHKLIASRIASLIVLAIGHVPVPWGHDHETMGGDQLESHLASYHAGAEETLSLKWHVHVSCVGLSLPVPQDGDGVDDSSNQSVFHRELPQMLVRRSTASHRGPRKRQYFNLLCGSTKCADVGQIPLQASRGALFRLSPSRPNGPELYYLYCSLLI
jgi:hypothetical protein